MPTHPLLPLLIGCALMTCSAAENMLGRQSQNEGLPVLPAPAVVTVDGALSEWDWSSRIWCFADVGVRAVWTLIQTVLIIGSILFVGGLLGEMIAVQRAELRELRRRVDEDAMARRAGEE